MTDADGAAVRVVGVVKTYRRGRREVAALRDLSLAIARGEFLALMGPSGSGKSTLLNLIAGLDTPSAGEILVDDVALSTLGDDALTDLRRTRVGVIFQLYNLLPSITVAENVALPLRASGGTAGDVRERVTSALAAVGLGARATHLPEELSGGEGRCSGSQSRARSRSSRRSSWPTSRPAVSTP
jgi:putative ABC transport system ATP-binding protein